MSAHGISPAWVALGDGLPDLFIIGFHALNVTVDASLVGDVEKTVTLAASAGTSFIGDVDKTHTLSITVGIQVSAP